LAEYLQVNPAAPARAARAREQAGARAHAADPLRAARLGMWATLALWVTVIALHNINIGGRWDPISLSTWITIALWLGCFALAYEMALRFTWRQSMRRAPEPQPPEAWSNRWTMILTIVAATGASLVIYDFAILRQYGFSTSAASIRLQETVELWQGGKSISPLSGLGRLLLPAMIPAYCLAVISWKQLRTETRAALVVAAMIILFEQIFFEGGRFFLTILVATLFISHFLFGRGGARVRKKISIPFVRISIAGTVLLVFFSQVFVARIVDRNDFFWLAYLGMARELPLDVNYSQAPLFEGFIGPIWFSICMLWLYITHGLNQLDFLLSLEYFDHAYGAMQFLQISQIVTLVSGIDFRYDAVANVPIAGTYSTFLGENYIDFGRVGTVLSGGVLGALTGGAMFSFVRGRISLVSLPAPILLVVCVFTPVVSLVLNLWPAMVWAAIVGRSAKGWRDQTLRRSVR
jgi:oligosaccharide repeat unit polymerase